VRGDTVTRKGREGERERGREGEGEKLKIEDRG
jgi:hypothetical protein